MKDRELRRSCQKIDGELRPGEAALEFAEDGSIATGPVLHIGPTARGDPRRGNEYIGSAPFSALLAGVLAAGELVKARGLGRDRDGTLAMYHFVSRNLYVERTSCTLGCECSR